MSKKNSEYMLANDHANVTLSSLVYDPDESNVLVAAFTVATSVELLAAIKAQLEKHGKNGLRAIDFAGTETIPLHGAGFGYVTCKTSLRQVSARGMAVAFLHKAATDPSLVPGNCFYVVATADQKRDVPKLFIQRLMSATYHTILPKWADYLLAVGLKKKLVTKLPIASNGDFVRAFRVERRAEGWQAVIGAGLRDGKIVSSRYLFTPHPRERTCLRRCKSG